jgi:predicted amidohydrolase
MKSIAPAFAFCVLFMGLSRLHAATENAIAEFRNFPPADTNTGASDGWTPWSPRDEIAPKYSVEAKGGPNGSGALKIETGSAAEFGAWRRRVEGLAGGRTYRFGTFYRADHVPHERRSIIARLEWLDAQGKAVRPPDYAIDARQEGVWTRIEHIAPAPENARSVQIDLALGFAENAAVWWGDIQLIEESSPPARVVRAMTIFHRPRGTKSAAESVEQFCGIAESAATEQPDIICLPEGITVVGTGKTYLEVSEPIPGPTTRRLGDLAKKLNSYIVAGIYEREGNMIYNTAVLVGRKGELAGVYRKTHLPREEWEAGITPGDSYPVFETDFGKVGLLVCWDVQFPEPARALALKGAELILLPIWGGSEVLAQARAIENHLFLITSSFDMKTFIVDPAGKILAEAGKEQPVAVAELHLDRKIFQPWLGDMKNRTWKERRPDIAVE